MDPDMYTNVWTYLLMYTSACVHTHETEKQVVSNLNLTVSLECEIV